MITRIAYAPNSSSQLYVLNKQSNSLCMMCTQISVLEQTNHVIFCRHLNGLHSQCCPSQFILKLLLANLPDHSLKGSNWDNRICRFLKFLHFMKNIACRFSFPLVSVLSQYEGIHSFIPSLLIWTRLFTQRKDWLTSKT